MKYEPTDEVFLCRDGKYRWVYERSLYRDLSVLFLIIKVFGAIVFIMWIIYMVILLFDSADAGDLVNATVFNFGMFLLLCALSVAGYFLYAVMMGGVYCVVFTMDEKGVLHEQHKAQAKKAGLIAEITILVGVMAGRPTTVGIGMNSMRSKMYSKFSKVDRIRTERRKHIIHVDGNEVYARDEDFDFVLEYICEHCPNARIQDLEARPQE